MTARGGGRTIARSVRQGAVMPRWVLHTVLGALGALPLLASAQPITLVPNTVNTFRDTRGANDVGIGQGDRVQFGADISGGSAGVSIGAIYGPTGFTLNPGPCNPLAVNLNFCSRSVAFDSGRLEPWTIRFTRGSESLQILGPSLSGAEQAVPFPVSVTLSGSGVTPTVSWVVPNGFAADGFRVNVYDKGRRLSNGQADVVHSIAIDPGATSYQLPSTFNSGLPLLVGGSYSINLQLIETRSHAPFAGSNAEILRRSSSFFDFTPLTGNDPPAVALPTVSNGVYHFNVQGVGPGSITFIDPEVAIGYDYAIGAGDPNFASVLLPDIGDGVFTLEYTDAGGAHSVTVEDGAQYFFGQGGVSGFRVGGIEASAGLDPANTTAFITGLTFTADGSFTGTMTPITITVVPEPATLALMTAGLLLVGAATRARRNG
jgi:hypothetical protein